MIAVGSVLLVTIAVFAWVSIRMLRAQHLENLIRSASQFSDTVNRSTHHAMLQNRWEDAFYIMNTIAQQEGVVRVRIFNKDGLILFSTDKKEMGQVVDKRAESCYACHAAEKPLQRLNVPQRARIVARAGKARILGMITPIYNEPSCSNAACHAHPPGKSVLGVLDIGLSLAQADAHVSEQRRRIALFSGVLVLLVPGVLFLLLQRGVIRPVRSLVEGTQRVAQGDLEHVIDVETDDEIGMLATSFNDMTRSLLRAQEEVGMLVTTLEDRVRARTKDLEQAQAKLIQSEKLASLGRLSASIAHEINNPLAGILTYAKLLARKLQSGPVDAEKIASTLKSLMLIERETDRCIAIVRNLLDFARQREPSFEEVDVNAVISEALTLLANRIALDGIVLETKLGELPLIHADFGQLRQALVNIALNACQAMQKGGTLTVATRFSSQDRMAEVEITDSGVGIPPEQLRSIFDPFFTTKEKGTGLGLSVVHGIIERHGGQVDIKSKVGEGTCVTVRLPAAPPAA